MLLPGHGHTPACRAGSQPGRCFRRAPVVCRGGARGRGLPGGLLALQAVQPGGEGGHEPGPAGEVKGRCSLYFEVAAAPWAQAGRAARCRATASRVSGLQPTSSHHGPAAAVLCREWAGHWHMCCRLRCRTRRLTCCAWWTPTSRQGSGPRGQPPCLPCHPGPSCLIALQPAAAGQLHCYTVASHGQPPATFRQAGDRTPASLRSAESAPPDRLPLCRPSTSRWESSPTGCKPTQSTPQLRWSGAAGRGDVLARAAQHVRGRVRGLM